MADMSAVPLIALSSESKFLLSTLLNPIKCIPTDDGYPRDWRGIADLFSFGGELIPAIASNPDPISFILDVVTKKNPKTVIKDLQIVLEKIERWDVVDDTQPVFVKDAQKYYDHMERNETSAEMTDNNIDSKMLTVDDLYRVKAGLSMQRYDAFLLFADEDTNFVEQIIEYLEQKHNLKLCIKDRDLISGITFEHTAIMKLISERCNRLIVVLSPNFIKSTANEFFLNYAQAIGIEQNHRKIIPCLYQQCELPPQLKYTLLLDYNRSKLYDFWGRLKDSVRTVANDTLKNDSVDTKCEDVKINLPEVPSTSTLSLNSEMTPTTSKETSTGVAKTKSKLLSWTKKNLSPKSAPPTNLSSDDSQNDLIKKLPSLEGLDSLESSSISMEKTSKKVKKHKSIKACAKKIKSFVIKS
ncbi:myeloid differentiation primary response protein MyD88 [Microplitis demolitor]|uniref:myeloid differentiation primary response protein MyD88 n=1 Tax=Microplitis demolitor TaxID=69319 RepID=UPI0004CD95A2|nr:myeloid differentiation primary response protein MyD88 [Microplitis demolitor]